MGFRFGRSFKLPGGFRLNVSKRGIGASFGVKGLRFGTGPRGNRITASLPGTGLGYSTSWGGGVGGGTARAERAARAQQRALLAAQRDYERMVERERNAYEVAVFENHLALLTSLHRESWTPWDWRLVAAHPPPSAPQLGRWHEESASQALAAYSPGVMDRLLGGEERTRAELVAAIERARHADQAAYQYAMQAHAQAVERWHWFQRIANGVLAGDVDACQAVLQYLGPFAELQEMGSSLDVGIERPWCVEAWFGARSSEVVPTEVLSLTSTGKISRKKMPQGRYWELYQDHICSAAFRIGREIFALLPIPVVFVHATVPMLDTRTGAFEDTPVLSVAFEREPFIALNFDGIDPSDALQAFEHAMKFKKTTGFQRVEFLSPDDADVIES